MVSTLKKEKFFLIVLLALSFFVRSLVFHFYLSKNQNYWQIDSNTYHQIGLSIAKGEGIVIAGQSSFYRLPGYSLFLSLYYKLFGVDTKNVLWLQIFLASFIPLLIFFLCLCLFPQFLLLAKIVSIYSVFHLGLVLYSGFFMTESLFILFFLLFSILFFSKLHLFFCHFGSRRKKTLPLNLFSCQSDICSGPSFIELELKLEEDQERRDNFYRLIQLFFAGLFLGVASLIRPVGQYVIILCFIVLLFSIPQGIRQKIKNCLVLFIGWLIPVLPWLLRNYLLLGQIFFHTLPGGHFLYFSASRILMHEQNYRYEHAQNVLRKEVDNIAKQKKENLGRNITPIEWCNIRMAMALKYFKKYPLLAIKNWIRDIFRTSFSLHSSELLYLDSGRKSVDYFAKDRSTWDMIKRYLFPETKNWYSKVIVWVEILLYLFILLGIIFGFMQMLICSEFRVQMCVWLKVLPFIFLFLILGLSGGYSRMRLPVEPYIIILAFSFWVGLIRRKLA